MDRPIIRTEDLRKVYRVGAQRIVALDNINFDIPEGQICSVVGSSGSGKSTLLNQLAGLEKPTHGRVLIGGRNISAFSESQLARFWQKNLGFIFQSYNLIPSLTALENVCQPLIYRGVPKSRRLAMARRILRDVGLEERMSHRPAQMSGGQQQRVGIARAFVANPRIIFADEPTGNLDDRTTLEVIQMMLRLCREYKRTMIIVTHDRGIAALGDRVLTLVDGNVVGDELIAAAPESEPDSESAAENPGKADAEATSPPEF